MVESDAYGMDSVVVKKDGNVVVNASNRMG